MDEGSQVALYLGASGPMLQYSYFFKDSPAGLVLDVKGDWKLAVPSSLAVKSGFVDKIMFKAHSGNLRVIIELKAQQGKPLAEPVIEKLAQGLVVKLKK